MVMRETIETRAGALEYLIRRCTRRINGVSVSESNDRFGGQQRNFLILLHIFRHTVRHQRRPGFGREGQACFMQIPRPSHLAKLSEQSAGQLAPLAACACPPA
jgi:hypothetical protein